MVYYIIYKMTGLTDPIHKDTVITRQRGELKKQSGWLQVYLCS